MRYKEKLSERAKQAGVQNIDELKVKLKDEIETKKKEFNKIDPLQQMQDFEANLLQQNKGNVEKLRKPRSPSAPEKPFKSLESFVDVEKMKGLSSKEVEFIWRARFQSKEKALISVIPSITFAKFYLNARKNPFFILPLPKEGQDGIELHFVQWSFVGAETTHCMMTSLAEYKLHGEYARPHTVLSFHSELQTVPGVELILMNGTVEQDTSVSLQEAQLLLLNLQRFYGALEQSDAQKRRVQLLRDFTTGSERFSIDALIEEAQSMDS